MDGFFMSSDLKFWDRPPGFIFGDDDYFIGGVEDWAVQLIQERQGYYHDYEDDDDLDDSWVDCDIDDEFSEREVWRLACRASRLTAPGSSWTTAWRMRCFVPRLSTAACGPSRPGWRRKCCAAAHSARRPRTPGR